MEPEKKSNGALIGLVIIVIVLVLGGIYIWISNKNAADRVPVTDDQSQTLTDEDSAALDALEQELDGTNTEIDVDANAVN